MLPESPHTHTSCQAFTTLAYQWHALYTRPKYEKRVLAALTDMHLECYLPLQTTLRQWSDRRKMVEIPLFSGYVFAKVSEREYYDAVNIKGVVRYVSFGGKAANIPEKQIRLIRNLLAEDLEATECLDNLPEGTPVQVQAGPLMGITGSLVKYSGKERVIIHIEEICKSVMVSIPLPWLALAG